MKNSAHVKWLSILFIFVVCGGTLFLSPTAEAQAKEAASAVSSDMKKKKYTDIPASCFDGPEGTMAAEDALKALGVDFPDGASATYHKKKKTLVVINTETNLEAVTEAVRIYKETSIPCMVKVIDTGCKVHYGKINKKAKVFVFICISEKDIENYNKSRHNVEEAIDGRETYKDIVRNIGRAKKKKGAEIIVLANEGSDMATVNKIAKAWRIKAPVATYSKPGDLSSLCVVTRLETALFQYASYNVVVVDCYGNEGPCTGSIAITSDSSEILTRVEHLLKEGGK